MPIYLLKRLLQVIPVVLGTTFLIYFMVFALPGDPLTIFFGDRTPNPALLERLREQYHLDQPFIVQYLLYLGGIFRGDLGTSFSGAPVSQVLLQTFPATLKLAAMAIAFEFLFAIVIGAISAVRKGGIFDSVSMLIGLVWLSLPIFVIAFVGQYVFGIELGWLRTTVRPEAPVGDLLLPALVLALSLYPVSMRLTRSSMIETLGADFVRTAYARGLSTPRVLRVHVLRNSLIPVVTNSAANFGILIVGATVTEGIFNVPGVGRTLYQAIVRGESPTVVSFVTVMVLLYLAVNLIVDLLYAVLDPRIRYV